VNASASDLKLIFDKALELAEPAERADYLATACGDNVWLRAEVESLLDALDKTGSFLETPALPLVRLADKPVHEGPGTVIGTYKLLEQIGEGGFGIVFMAEQQEPIRRKVALKVLKPGMDTRQVIARFEAERQALALMDHPNIAKVFEGGQTTSGRPYFVMDLVKGVPITEFCDQSQLTPRERLELFVHVCQAVQHAHQKGIIHRDIKPTNVLVTMQDGAPLVKVIDFGIAKALGQQLTDKTLFTAFAQMIGTPLYMAPEQAVLSNVDVDTRSDIYSLGVLLYELLTGTTPFDKERFKEAGYDEIRRIIREEEPPRPSTRISTMGQAATSISTQRQSDPKRLSQLFHGELDWIVMKCLEKDRNRRYETANSMARDIERYLHDEPVQACPPSAMYRFRKFARRNKAALMTAALIAGILALSTPYSAWQAFRATEALEEKGTALAAANDNYNEAKKQEKLATQNAKTAEEQKQAASEQELLARRRFYAAQMNLAQQAWEAGNPARVLELLESQRPRFDEQDLRNFEWYHLWGLCNKDLRLTLRGHTTEIACIAFSPDGKTLVSASDTNANAKLWDVSTGQLRSTLNGSHGFRGAAAFSPDGKILVTAGFVGQGEVWEVATGRSLPIYFPLHSMERAVAFSPDGKTLAGGNYSGTIKLWDVASDAGTELSWWRQKASIQAHSFAVGCLAFSRDGKTLASTSADGGSRVRLWDLRHDPPRPTRQFKGQTSAAFSPDGKTLAVAGDAVKLYDLNTGKQLASSQSYLGAIYSVAFSPDGKKLAFGTQSRNIQLWDHATGEEQSYPHRGPVRSVAFSPDGKVLASASEDGLIKLWDLVPKQQSATQKILTGSRCPHFSADGKMLAFVGSDATVKLYELATGQVKTIQAPGGNYTNLVLSPEGKILALSGGAVRLFDVAAGADKPNIKGSRTFRCLALSPDGKTVGTADSTYSTPVVQLWDLGTKQVRITLKGTPNGVASALAFSPDGKWLAVGGQHEWVKLWDAVTGEERATVQKGLRTYGTLGCLAFSPDSKLLATGNWDGTVKLWDVATRHLRASLKGHTAQIKSMAFFPDGRTLVTGSEDRTLKLWDVAIIQERLTFKGYSPDWHSVAISPDGKTLATVAEPQTITLRRAAMDKEALAFKTELDKDDAQSPVSQNEACERFCVAGQVRAAEEAARTALARLEKLCTAFPSLPEYNQELARSRFTLSLLLTSTGRSQEAGEIKRRAQQLLDKLAPDHLAELAAAYSDLSGLLKEADRGLEAARSYRQGLEIQERLMARYPDDAHSLIAWAKVYCRRQQWTRANALLARLFEQLPPKEAPTWEQPAGVPLLCGDVAAYRKRCAHMLERFG
jgi:WD40 repeat protein/serine/threonine protein kinase